LFIIYQIYEIKGDVLMILMHYFILVADISEI